MRTFIISQDKKEVKRFENQESKFKLGFEIWRLVS